MVKIAALVGDYWHPAADAKAGLEATINKLPNKEKIELQYMSHDDVLQVLNEKPDLLINAGMGRVNPLEDHAIYWLTEELDQKVVQYVEGGGSVLAWHAGMASYPGESSYLQMLRGSFDYHPPGLQEVTYHEKNGENTFTIADEHYFVHCDAESTNVDLWSTSSHGDCYASWRHSYGKGKVCCFTPAHTKEGMLNENVSSLLVEKIKWLLSQN